MRCSMTESYRDEDCPDDMFEFLFIYQYEDYRYNCLGWVEFVT